MLFCDDHVCLGLAVRERLSQSLGHAERERLADSNRDAKPVDDALIDRFTVQQSIAVQQRVGHAVPVAQRNANTVPDANRLADWRDTGGLAEYQPAGLDLALTEDRAGQDDRAVSRHDLRAV